MRTTGFALSVGLAMLWATRARAQRPPSADPRPPVLFAPQPPEGRTTEERQPGPMDEPPPSRPRARGLVLESLLGVLGFAGEFRHVAPPAYWLHVDLGYDVLPWLLLFGEGELAFTDTSESADESGARAFHLWGFSGGARGVLAVRGRLALVGQAEVGALAASVPHGALANLGYARAETLGIQLGGRVGVEWRLADRHLAFCALAGARDVPGFARSGASSGAPVMWDTSVGLRYAF